METQEENIEFVTVNELRIGDYIVLNDGACVILSIAKSHPGKHGSAKALIIARNIFTDKKIETICPVSHMIKCPIVTKTNYVLLNIEQYGAISLLDNSSNQVDGLVTLENNEVCNKIKIMFDEGKTISVCVISALGNSKIFDCSEEKQEK